MPDDFRFDVFLSHSSKDKPVWRDIAWALNSADLKPVISIRSVSRPSGKFPLI
ncbi:MAG: hypothetical protein IPK22_24075 [Verrucomicrobiaceae bacterium]|nr:hypothetical protein [Verrucomicrobiaceae bacterium]